jgi:hypothetical protein
MAPVISFLLSLNNLEKGQAMRVIITCREVSVGAMASRLMGQGLKVESVLVPIRVITGEIDSDKLVALESIPGITVEPELTVQLPHPDASVQ